MGFDDIVNKGKKLYEQNSDKLERARRSEKAEGVSDKLLDGAAGFAKRVLPDQHDDKIDDARRNADRHIGNE